MTSSFALTARQAYWRLAALARPGKRSAYPADFSKDEIEIVETVQGKTMTTPERVVSLVRAIEYVVANKIEGDIVECGVWKGGSMMAVALALKRLNAKDRILRLYDTYDGMPPPTDLDKDHLGTSAASQLSSQDRDAQIWARAQLDEVVDNMRSTEYPSSNIQFIKGKVEDTLPSNSPRSIALLRLDTDWYESTRHELEHLYPLITLGGVLILDDYGQWQGARRAVDEYIQSEKLRLLLCRIDMCGRIAIKQS